MSKKNQKVISVEKVDNKKAEITLENGEKIYRQLHKNMVWVYNTPYEIEKGYFQKALEKVEIVPEATKKEKYETKEEIHHEKYNMILACVKNNIPVYLVGPAGSGKNHTLEQIAWETGLDFYFTNSVQQEYKITGFIDAGGNYHETEFFKAFKNGGLFFLDEMDASIPEVLVLLNAAIANRYFEFPTGRIEAHHDFRVVAAGNTFGNGASEQYTGRLVLDQATLDRFAVIEFDYDFRVELHIAKGNAQLVEFVRKLREIAKERGIRATFSYRCISMTIKLEETGVSLKDIMTIAIFKGLDHDTVKTFSHFIEGNRYSMFFNMEVKGK